MPAEYVVVPLLHLLVESCSKATSSGVNSSLSVRLGTSDSLRLSSGSRKGSSGKLSPSSQSLSRPTVSTVEDSQAEVVVAFLVGFSPLEGEEEVEAFTELSLICKDSETKKKNN